MSYRQDKNYNFAVYNFGDYSIITYAIPPLTASIRGQTFAVRSRIFTVYKILFNPA